ncbi:hypothetical protein A1351_02075 [Methylosinus sp. R-45379]|uniref:VHL beta domain-containing protein n=1 Tax=unclassified Methylosinus TaxID=2624500 RepID=UPI0004630AFF|nr:MULTISPECIES: hypothetical protein [unclassified Methylosinus]OAI26241.1 hypothetical protein A1351_02075 [Methylosinus sp. R-45379]
MTIRQSFAVGIVLAALGSPLSASADETAFEQLGRWSVAAVSNGGKFAYCSADVDNGKVQLRLATNGDTWRVGVPYYESKKKIAGYYGFGDAAEQADFKVSEEGWAFLAIDSDQLNAFLSNPSFSINLDRGLQSWKLSGAGAAIEKASACARSKGQKQAAAAVSPTPGTGRDCPPPGKYRSQNSARPVTVTFFNGSKRPVEIYWIGFDGQWKKYHTLGPDKNVNQKTFATHPWVATDARGNCFREVFMPDPDGGPENNNFQVWFD